MEKSKSDYWISSGLLNLFQNFSGAIFGILGFAMVTRMLSETELGAWGLFLTVGTILEMVRNGLVQNAVIKYVSSNPDEESDILSASLTITSLLTVFCMLLIVCFGNYFSLKLNSPQIEKLLYVYIAIFIVSGILTQLSCIEQAHFSYKGVVACNFVRQSVFFAFLTFCFLTKNTPSLLHMVYVQLVAVVLAVFTSWIYVKKYIHFSYQLKGEWITRIFNYGKYAFGTSVSSLLSGTVDQWMIANMMNTAAVASFRVAISITNLVDIPTNTIATIVFPQSAKRMETDGKEAIKYLYERSVGAILAVLIPAIVIMYLFDDLVMSILASEKYIKAVPILNITLLYALLIPYGRQFGAILDSIGKTKVTFTIVVITASLNLGLNFIFIKQWGALGAAIATLCSNIVGFAIAQWILHRELGVNAFHPVIYAWHFYTEFYQKYIKKYLFRAKDANNPN